MELEETLEHFDDPSYFDISESYSVIYHRFLSMDLSNRPAIRGQLEGPISFGFNILDQDDRPILFDDTVRSFMLEFMAQRINVQLGRLKALNQNAFMFVDEPGLQYIFSAIQRFLSKGGVIVWGIVPTGFETFAMEDIPSMILRIEKVWNVLEKYNNIQMYYFTEIGLLTIKAKGNKFQELRFKMGAQLALRLWISLENHFEVFPIKHIKSDRQK